MRLHAKPASCFLPALFRFLHNLDGFDSLGMPRSWVVVGVDLDFARPGVALCEGAAEGNIFDPATWFHETKSWE